MFANYAIVQMSPQLLKTTMPIAARKIGGNIGNENQQCCNFYFKGQFKLSF